MAGGLFSSPYGKTGKGLFSALFSEHGTFSPVKRMDVRLGETEDGPATPGKLKIPEIFFQDVAGIPIWLITIFLLGFAYSKKKNA